MTFRSSEFDAFPLKTSLIEFKCIEVYVLIHTIRCYHSLAVTPSLTLPILIPLCLRFVLQTGNTPFYRSLISKCPQSTNDCLRLVAQIALMSESLPLVHIADMNLYKRYVDPRKSIPQRNTLVCERARVDYNRIDPFEARSVYAIKHVALVVGLVRDERGTEGGGICGRGGFDVGKCFCAVDVWFACTEKVEIGTVEEKDLFGWHVCYYGG